MKRKNLLLLFLLFPAFIFAQETLPQDLLEKNFAVGDFNNDGFIDDLAHFTIENNAPVIETFNSSGMSFYKNEYLKWQSRNFDIAKTHGKIVSGDFDNDGFHDDLAAFAETGEDKTKIFVWLNQNGNFTKETWWFGPDFNANQVNNTIVSGDFDNDGFVDDIAAFYDYQDYTTKVFVWKSTRETFNWPSTMWYGGDFDASKLRGSMVSGDFDQDGFVDDIAGFYNYENNATKLFIWQSNKSSFVWPRTTYYNENYDIDKLQNHIVAGDFDSNGFMNDIVTFESQSDLEVNAKMWQINNFRLVNTASLGQFSTSQNYLLVGDFNKDNNIAEILDVSENQLNVLKTDKDYMFYPENWLTLKTESKNTSIENTQFLAENNLSIYPTASNDYINIAFDYDIQGKIEVYDLLGKQVKNEIINDSHSKLTVNDLSKGTYLLRVVTEGKIHKEKITIQ